MVCICIVICVWICIHSSVCICFIICCRIFYDCTADILSRLILLRRNVFADAFRNSLIVLYTVQCKKIYIHWLNFNIQSYIQCIKLSRHNNTGINIAQGEGAQCLRASTFSSFSKCFGNRFFCIFCKPHTYSHPFLPTLVSYKEIWPIYGFVHFSVTKKRAKLGSNLKQLIKENFRFPVSNYDFFLLNTSHTEDMRQKNTN